MAHIVRKKLHGYVSANGKCASPNSAKLLMWVPIWKHGKRPNAKSMRPASRRKRRCMDRQRSVLLRLAARDSVAPLCLFFGRVHAWGDTEKACIYMGDFTSDARR